MEHQVGPVVLVTSPHAGSAHGRDPEAALRAAGVAIGERLEVSALDSRQPQGGRWRAAGVTAAVAAGGDGTVGAVASHLAGTDLPLGILPLGTANDVARSLGLPLDLGKAAEVVAGNATRTIDLGAARPAASEPGAVAELEAERAAGIANARTERIARAAAAGAYFIHALTLGINVEFARLATNATRRARLGPLTYIASALQCVTTFRPVAVKARLEGVVPGAYMAPLPSGTTHGKEISVVREDGLGTIEGNVVQIAAIVTPVFGGARNLRLPDVALSDQLLDFVVIEALEPRHLRQMVERVQAMLEQFRHAEELPEAAADPLQQDVPGLWRFKARAAHIATPEEVDVTLDGEVRGRTPLDVYTEPDALRVLVSAPAAIAAPAATHAATGEVSGA